MSGIEGEVPLMPTQFEASPGLQTEFQFLRAHMYKQLIQDADAPDVITRLMLERLTYMYALTRQKEAGADDAQGFEHDRAYKEMNQLILSTLDRVQRKQQSEVDVDDVREKVIGMFIEAIPQAVEFLPATTRKQVMESLAEALS